MAIPAIPSKQIIDASIEAIFEPFDCANSPNDCDIAVTGLINLCGVYFSRTAPTILEQGGVRVDYFNASEAIMRFQRDVYGVQRFHKHVNGMSINEPDRKALLAQFGKVGIRINSELPFKTRIAAAFALWMTTFRPISVDPAKTPQPYTRNDLIQLNGAITHWISTVYLRNFGKVDHGSDPDAGSRLDRIRYDFTYRCLTLSPLEMLYCSLFRP